jgi:hypothetical protein
MCPVRSTQPVLSANACVSADPAVRRAGDRQRPCERRLMNSQIETSPRVVCAMGLLLLFMSACSGSRSALSTQPLGASSTDTTSSTESLPACGTMTDTCNPNNLGGATCSSMGMGTGTLRCDQATCSFNTSMCSLSPGNSGGGGLGAWLGMFGRPQGQGGSGAAAGGRGGRGAMASGGRGGAGQREDGQEQARRDAGSREEEPDPEEEQAGAGGSDSTPAPDAGATGAAGESAAVDAGAAGEGAAGASADAATPEMPPAEPQDAGMPPAEMPPAEMPPEVPPEMMPPPDMPM